MAQDNQDNPNAYISDSFMPKLLCDSTQNISAIPGKVLGKLKTEVHQDFKTPQHSKVEENWKKSKSMDKL